MPITLPSRSKVGPPDAEIDRSVDLREVVVGAEMHITTASGNDAAGDGGVEAKRIADGKHPVAYPRSIAVAQPTDGKGRSTSILRSARPVLGSRPMIWAECRFPS
jgi:hypothetical protein